MWSVIPLARSRNEVDAEAAAMELFRDEDCTEVYGVCFHSGSPEVKVISVHLAHDTRKVGCSWAKVTSCDIAP